MNQPEFNFLYNGKCKDLIHIISKVVKKNKTCDFQFAENKGIKGYKNRK